MLNSGEQYCSPCGTDAAYTHYPTIQKGYALPVTYNGVHSDTYSKKKDYLLSSNFGSSRWWCQCGSQDLPFQNTLLVWLHVVRELRGSCIFFARSSITQEHEEEQRACTAPVSTAIQKNLIVHAWGTCAMVGFMLFTTYSRTSYCRVSNQSFQAVFSLRQMSLH